MELTWSSSSVGNRRSWSAALVWLCRIASTLRCLVPWIFNRTKEDSLSSPVLFWRAVLTNFKVLLAISLSAVVTGRVQAQFTSPLSRLYFSSSPSVLIPPVSTRTPTSWLVWLVDWTDWVDSVVDNYARNIYRCGCVIFVWGGPLTPPEVKRKETHPAIHTPILSRTHWMLWLHVRGTA